MDTNGRWILKSDYKELEEGFSWAKNQALAYVFRGDPVGDWYEAALPGREAFCMRDVSHQSNGAHILGLSSHNRNMLMKFASNISEDRKWCSYWEINKYDRPAPVDYKSNMDFWYNLPSNFDVLDCCYRQYLLTGDRTYIDDPVFINFYNRTVEDYIKAWDINGDGLMEHVSEYGYRGIASYMEGKEGEEYILVGADLVAAQYAAFTAYAAIQEIKGNNVLRNSFTEKAFKLKEYFNVKFWDDKNAKFYDAIIQDGSMQSFSQDASSNYAIMYFGISDEKKADKCITEIVRQYDPDRFNVETKSYIPEVYYRYGYNEAAYNVLAELMHPRLARREYPEVSYSVISSVAFGMLGISSNPLDYSIGTFPRLVENTGWVELGNVPLLGNEICIRHEGNKLSTVTNLTGRNFTWKACIPGTYKELKLDGKILDAYHSILLNGIRYTWVKVSMDPGEIHTVSAI